MRKRAVMFGAVVLLGACSSGGEAREFSGPEAHTIEEVQQLLVSAGWGCDALSDVQVLSEIPGTDEFDGLDGTYATCDAGGGPG